MSEGPNMKPRETAKNAWLDSKKVDKLGIFATPEKPADIFDFIESFSTKEEKLAAMTAFGMTWNYLGAYANQTIDELKEKE